MSEVQGERPDLERATRDAAGDILADAALRQNVELDDTTPAPEGGEALLRDHEVFGPRANVYFYPKHHTVTLLLDERTANYVLYAVRVLAADLEAHAREARFVAARMPADSYGAANRHAIALRHERIAWHLRMLEGNYRDVVETAMDEADSTSPPTN
jgi:hypothetical protein